MAFLAEDDDAMRAFEAVLSFVDDFTVDETTTEGAVANEATTVQPPVENGWKMPSNGALNCDDISSSASAVVTVNATDNSSQRSRQTSTVPRQPTGNGTAARPVFEAIKSRRRAADNARKRMLRNAGPQPCA